ncbi:MAG: sigma-70 family RNA polymerase sigma factor [Planctomycetes bacterium]|nr:sigma-70 family RNA polymerase sigma factor [Planctomycetota bacterium]
MSLQDLSDEQLAAQAAREGSDGPAFVTLVDRFRDRVWRVCYRLLGNEADAHDAAQEVFVRLFLHRQKFEGRSKYSTWVHGIAIRTCLTLRRGRGRRRRREDLAAQQAAVSTPGESGLKLDLVQMLDVLDEEDRALVILKYVEDYSYEELAEIFELSVSACKMRVARARDKIQQRYGEGATSKRAATPADAPASAKPKRSPRREP